MASGCAEVIIWPEGLIECGNQIEEGLSAALVTEGALILTTLALAQSAGAEARGLGWGQCLQYMGLALLAELLEHVLVVSRHLT